MKRRSPLKSMALALLAASALGGALPSAPAMAQTAPAQSVPVQSLATQSPSTQARPNFLVIVADDLGWSDLGAFGGEIRTPNLDALALKGVRFTGFHTAPTCSPTRSMLLSGVDNHEAGLGTMAELLNDRQRGHDGYEGFLNNRVASIAELLRTGGYRTLMAGKWHLGLTDQTSPTARGFDHSYALLQGLSNHFGADQTRKWGKAGERSTYRDEGKIVHYPEGKYVDDQFADKLISYLGQPSTQPFFAYLTFTGPHWPMQAPPEDIARYKGRYDAGYEALRDERLARQKQLGLAPADARPHANELAKPWASLTPEQKAYEARKMEIYAAMVDRLDQNVGRVIAELKRTGQYDNTVIIFLGDNGPEGSDISGPKGGGFNKMLKIDNSLDNLGKANSYVGYGPGWAEANSSPSRLVKGYTTEGGIRTTAFAVGAGVEGNRISGANLSVTDIAPTLLQLAGVTQPATFDGHPILPYEGHSLVPLLEGKAATVRGADEVLGYELFYRRGLRKGDWKVVYLPKTAAAYGKQNVGDGVWHLYNLASDPGETTDLSASQPDKLKELIAAWNAYAAAHQVVLPAAQ